MFLIDFTNEDFSVKVVVNLNVYSVLNIFLEVFLFPIHYLRTGYRHFIYANKCIKHENYYFYTTRSFLHFYGNT